MRKVKPGSQLYLAERSGENLIFVINHAGKQLDISCDLNPEEIKAIKTDFQSGIVKPIFDRNFWKDPENMEEAQLLAEF